jgi:hypothetical protein
VRKWGQVEAAGQEWGGVWGLLAGGGPMEELVGEVFGDVGCVALWTQLHNSLRLHQAMSRPCLCSMVFLWSAWVGCSIFVHTYMWSQRPNTASPCGEHGQGVDLSRFVVNISGEPTLGAPAPYWYFPTKVGGRGTGALIWGLQCYYPSTATLLVVRCLQSVACGLVFLQHAK